MHSKVHVSAAVGIAGTALVLQVVGFVLPGWLVITSDIGYAGLGLWSMKKCAQMVCISFTWEQVFDASGQEMRSGSLAWKEYQVEATLSLIGAIFSVCLLTAQTIVMCVSKVSTTTKNINILAALGACTSIGSALLGFIVVGRMAYVNVEFMAEVPLISSPYALIIFGIGSFVSVCVCGMELALPGMIGRETQTPYTNFENVAI